MLTNSTKTILCPIDKSEKTIYLSSIISNEKKITRSDGCSDMNGSIHCQHCIANHSEIADFSLLSDSPKQ